MHTQDPAQKPLDPIGKEIASRKEAHESPSIIDSLRQGNEDIRKPRGESWFHNRDSPVPQDVKSSTLFSSQNSNACIAGSGAPECLNQLNSRKDLRTIDEDISASTKSTSQFPACPDNASGFYRYFSPSYLNDESSRETTDDACSMSSIESGDHLPNGYQKGGTKRVNNPASPPAKYRRPLRSKTLDVTTSDSANNSSEDLAANTTQSNDNTSSDTPITSKDWRRLSRTRSLSFAVPPTQRRNSLTISRKTSLNGLQCHDMKIIPFKGGNGGLKNAVLRAEAQGILGSDTKWVGTIAMPINCMDERMRNEIAEAMEIQSNCHPVYINDRVFEGHYLQFCKQILWPILHYQTPETYLQSQARYYSYYEAHSHWNNYKTLNQAFADKIVEQYNDGDTIWVNDYHLMLVPELVRQKLPEAKIAFFFHVAFPSSEVFRCLPQRNSLLTGMLGANCIGFQIAEYSRHFLQTCNRILAIDAIDQGLHTSSFVSKDNLRSDPTSGKHGNRFTSIVNCPIGIDKTSLDGWLQTDEVRKWREVLRKRWPNTKLIVARDKLDTIRGVKHKLLAYEQFLKSHPDWLNKCVLIEIGIGDLFENKELERDLYTIIERINSLGNELAVDHQHVMFLQQHIDFDQYVALLCEADTFVVTPLREGMNLTSHEFVYCNKTGAPLILSEFTGAASVLGEGSLLVNPWDKSEVAEAFYEALTMDEEEKMLNWKTLYEYVCNNSCTEWVQEFREEVEFACEEEEKGREDLSKRLDSATFASVYEKASGSGKRLFFLNLDGLCDSGYGVSTPNPSRSKAGTPVGERPSFLAPVTAKSSVVKPSPFDRFSATYVSTQRKISVLSDLSFDDTNKVYVISRESRRSMMRTFKRVPDVGLIAENGAFLLPANSSSDADWISLIDLAQAACWLKLVIPALEQFAERDPRVSVEIGESMITLDARPMFVVDPGRARTQAGELINHINDAFGHGEYPLHARLENNGVVVVSTRANHGTKAIEEAFQIEEKKSKISLLVMDPEGADANAETCNNLFDWSKECKAQGKVDDLCTISIGTYGTSAHWKLEGINALLNLISVVVSETNYS